MKRATTLALFAALISAACATSQPQGQQEAATMRDLPVPQLHLPNDRLITGGQPDASAWPALAQRGITTVINLRPQAEMDGRDEAGEVQAAGMRYETLPVAGAAGITMENARQLRQLLQGAEGPVLVHCASGNRVGALVALGAADAGATVEDAIAQGRAAGLSSAEARVRELLGAPAPKE
jgi:uncharacterized protein (TIGR01244 family)